jgi:UDP-N-acetylmuramate dehydrogenase
LSTRFEKALAEIPDIKLIRRYPASFLTTFHIGGEVAYVIYAKSTGALCRCVLVALETGTPYRIIGRGSNLLACDDGYEGAWILTQECNALHFANNRLEAECGATLSAVIEACAQRGLGGLENLWGIPGSVGGAVTMNAGAFGTQFSDLLTAVDVFDTVEARHFSFGYDACQFGYRSSLFQERRYVILGASLRCANSRTDLIRARMERVDSDRRASQPLEYPSAGSVFRRPVGAFAGKLIREAGLVGKQIGGAQVSDQHAGFIVNRGGATAEDVKQLIVLICQTVYEKTGIKLTTELIIES